MQSNTGFSLPSGVQDIKPSAANRHEAQIALGGRDGSIPVLGDARANDEAEPILAIAWLKTEGFGELLAHARQHLAAVVRHMSAKL